MSKGWNGSNRGKETLTRSLFLVIMQQMIEGSKKASGIKKKKRGGGNMKWGKIFYWD